MKIKDWVKWYKSLHISRKWFVILVLLRPIIDSFYGLKEASALASPLYIVGVLTPLLVVGSFFSHKFPRKNKTFQDIPMSIWAIFVAFNCLIFYFIDISIVAFGDLIKYCTPFILYFYCRRFVQSRQDMLGLITAFMFACAYPFFMLLYESIINPIGIDYLSAGRGGGSRIRGEYADIMNYAIYLAAFLIAMGYMYLRSIYEKGIKIKIKPIYLIMTLVFVLYGLTRIKHVSTWAVAIFCFVLFMLHNLKNVKGIAMVFALMIVILPFFAEDIYIAEIQPLINKEILVAKGERDSQQALNGRVNRWEKYIEIWEQMPAINHFIGVTTSNFPETDAMISAGMHSDYIRLLFLSGFIGLGFYLLSIFFIASNYFELRIPEKFLLAASVSALVLWSVSTIPTLYAPLLYFTYPIFSYALLPKERQYIN